MFKVGQHYKYIDQSIGTIRIVKIVDGNLEIAYDDQSTTTIAASDLGHDISIQACVLTELVTSSTPDPEQFSCKICGKTKFAIHGDYVVCRFCLAAYPVESVAGVVHVPKP